MCDIRSSLPKWFLERHKWIQCAAMRLAQKSDLTTEDISDLTELCLRDAGENRENSDNENYPLPSSLFSQGPDGSLRLCSISEVEGVNSLAPSEPLDFKEYNPKNDLTIIYGENGSGKSGYVRLLKHVCGARDPGKLLKNINLPENTVQKARIHFMKNGSGDNRVWSGQGSLNVLNGVDIFDASFGKVFIDNESRMTYEPPLLIFFTSLINSCIDVSKSLDAKVDLYPAKLPRIPIELIETAGGSWYNSLRAKTTSTEVGNYCGFSSEDQTEMKKLQLRLDEQAPAEKAKKLRKQALHIDSLIQIARKHQLQLSDENCRRLIVAKKQSSSKKEASEAAAKKIKTDGELGGIGSDVWIGLWDAARKYSETIAYTEIEYPNTSSDAHCVLCHQKISLEAASRLKSFDNFIKGEMQQAAENAMRGYEAAQKAIEPLPTENDLNQKIELAGLPSEMAGQVTTFFEQLQSRRNQLEEINSEDKIPTQSNIPAWVAKALAISKELNSDAGKYDDDTKSDNREEIRKNLCGLKAKKWLSENRGEIHEEINRKRILDQIQKAKRTTNTKSLSDKKGELADKLITRAFIDRFNGTLKNLQASHIEVEIVKTKVSRGNVLHKIQLIKSPDSGVADILSEGENRIVSIAAFLADVTRGGNQTPIIFDDPISSLDQTYEEAVVRVLIGLSENRQIIVFTHRLSLLGNFKHFAHIGSFHLNVACICFEDLHSGEPTPLPFSHCDIKTGLKKLMGQRRKDVEEAFDNKEKEKAENLLRAMCSDFRLLIESCIEIDLLCGVIARHQRPIYSTKVKALAKLTTGDCGKIDSLMTKYSKFEHSQSPDSQVRLPTLKQFMKDIDILKDWRIEYGNRAPPSLIDYHNEDHSLI